MANISYNQIHETLEETTMALILQKFQEIFDLLPKGTLTTNERQRYRSLNVRNLAFVEHAVKVQNTNDGSLLPALLSTNNMATDLMLFKQMRTLRSRVKNLDSILSDVERIVAHEAYGVALTQYKFYQIGSKVGTPNAKAAVEQLEWRFKNSGGKQKKDGKLL